MGTRSLTYVYDEYGEKILNLYRQFDGYPTGHGQELAEFLNSGRVVNGLNGVGKERQFNGAGCMAAQLVANFKTDAGGFYLYPTSVEDCGQDYEYHVYTDGEIRVKIMDCGCNMFGAAPYLQEEFGLGRYEARDVLSAWMKQFKG